MSDFRKRADHVAWCKQRALAYVDRNDLVNALASFGSDVQKHSETADDRAIAMLIATVGVAAAINNDAVAMRRFLEGFAE